jgi:hypothetical protein
MKTEIGMITSSAKGCQGSLAALEGERNAHNGFSSRAFRKNIAC